MASILKYFSESSTKQARKKQPYVDSLSGEVRERYFSKISAISDRDPYEIPKKERMHDVTEYLNITYFDICNYLVYKLSHYTQEEMRAYKSLESYKYFVHGWVHEISNLTINGLCLLTARVNHSQRMRETPNRPWIICESSGKILSAHCTCMAGLAESCSHVGALMFSVEVAVTIRNSATVTQKKAYWLLPSGVDKVEYSEVNDINFTSLKTRKKKLDTHIREEENVSSTLTNTSTKQFKVNAPRATPSQVSTFFTELSICGSRPGILSIIPPFSSTFIPRSLSTDYPTLFSELVDENCFGMSKEELTAHVKTVVDNLQFFIEQADNVEQDTKQQSSDKLWFSFRAGRVTASKFKDVCHTKPAKPSQSLIKVICYPLTKSFTNTATRWGCDHEKEARSPRYMTDSHSNFQVEDSGLILNPDKPFFGASPDGLTSCDCCGDGVLEVKCPFCKRQQTLAEAAEDQKFCLHKDENGNLKLKQNQAYYYQIQMQLFMCNRDFCDFLVWTEKDIHWERVEQDKTFWEEKSEMASRFFKEVLLLELVGKFYSQSNPSTATNHLASTDSPPSEGKQRSPLKSLNVCTDHENTDNPEKLICMCQKPYDSEYDSVIGCDNDKCPFEWLHFTCVGIKRAPKGSWYCPQCRHSIS